MDFLDYLSDEKAIAALRQVRDGNAAKLEHKPFSEIRELWDQLPNYDGPPPDLDLPAPKIGDPSFVSAGDLARIIQAARSLIPWKKGPFDLFGTRIDAEWRSDYKWDRLRPKLPSLRGKRILDVGANNGYYMFRAAAFHPELILSIDPFPRLWYQFHLLQKFAAIPNFGFEMWGHEELCWMKESFDVIFCMGIIYHHPNPIQIIRDLHAALRPGGTLVLESIIIPGDEPIALFPPGRYAQMRNVWFVPTEPTMRAFLDRNKFVNVETVAVNKHLAEEQRTTDWNPGPSYENFVGAENPDLTLEGHPPPYRAIILAEKKPANP